MSMKFVFYLLFSYLVTVQAFAKARMIVCVDQVVQMQVKADGTKPAQDQVVMRFRGEELNLNKVSQNEFSNGDYMTVYRSTIHKIDAILQYANKKHLLMTLEDTEIVDQVNCKLKS